MWLFAVSLVNLRNSLETYDLASSLGYVSLNTRLSLYKRTFRMNKYNFTGPLIILTQLRECLTEKRGLTSF